MKKLVVLLLFLMLLSGCGVNFPSEQANSFVTDISPETQIPSKGTGSFETDIAESALEGFPYEITYSAVTAYTDWRNLVNSSIIFELTNVGSFPLYVNQGYYELTDGEGNPVSFTGGDGSISGWPVIIGPGEKAYYHDSVIPDLNVNSDELTATLHPHLEPTDEINIRVDVSNLVIVDERDFGLEAIGYLTNNTNDPQNFFTVAIVIFDKSGYPIGVLDTLLAEDVLPGEKIKFSAWSSRLPPEMNTTSMSYYEVMAYPNI